MTAQCTLPARWISPRENRYGATTGNWTLRLYDGIRGSTNGVIVQLNKVKLEEGTLATAWSPAAEDGENAITRLNDAL